MKLSNKELEYVKVARSCFLFNDTYSLLTQYGFNNCTNNIYRLSKENKALIKIIDLFSRNPTLNIYEFDMEEEYGISVDSFVNYIREHLQNETSLSKLIIKNRKILLGNNIKYYLEPNNILRRFAYFNCFHDYSSVGYKLFFLEIHEGENLFYIMTESILLISLYPSLSKCKESLVNVLSYRLGLPDEEIYMAFDIDLSNSVKMKKTTQHYSDKTVLGICRTLAETHFSQNKM